MTRLIILFPMLIFHLLAAGSHRALADDYADHHVHLLSPELLKDWKSTGMPFSREDSAYTSASGLLKPPEKGTQSKLQKAMLIPMSHLYSNSVFRKKLGLNEEQEHRKVRSENDYISQEAKRHGNQSIAFCSVNILRPYGWREIKRCHSELGVRGLKLHLASSEFDLTSMKHLDQLTRVIAWAEKEDLAILLHFDPQSSGIDVEDVRRFIEKVLIPHPDLRISIAHLGGSGGYDEWTRSVFLTFVDWLDRENADGKPRPWIFFDLSAVILEEESEGVPATTDDQVTNLTADLRKAGLKRILFASDYPVFAPEKYAATLKSRLKLTDQEFAAIMRNRFPVLNQSKMTQPQ